VEVAGLERCAGADVWFELIEEDCVVLAVFDIRGEVGDSSCKLVDVKGINGTCLNVRPCPFGVLQVVVEPT
jgi:hypothetical protein